MTFYVGRELRKKDNTPPRPGLFLAKLTKFLERGFCPPQKIVSIFFTRLPHRRAFLVFCEKLFSGQGVSLFFYRDMYGGLAGWVSVQESSFSFRKSICSTDRCVVQMFSQLFFGGKNKDCARLYFCPRAGGGVWIFGFHNNKQIYKKSIGYPLSVFNKKPYSQTKCQTETGKKVIYPGA